MDDNFIVNLSDQQIDELQAYATPAYTKQNAENIERLFMKKTATKHRIGLRGLLIAAMFTICTTTVLAAGIYLNNFDRIRGIIGEEQAAGLQPIDASTVCDMRATAVGFGIELVAVGVRANVVDLYITLEDLVCDRLSGDVFVATSLRYVGDVDWRFAPQFSNIIDRAYDGTVTLHARMIFPNSIKGQELELYVDFIGYNFRTYEHMIDFDLSGAKEHYPAAWLWDTPVLPSHLHDIAVGGYTGNILVNISSIGIIDGMLHVQEQYDTAALNNWIGNVVDLINPEGEIIYPIKGVRDNTATISFGIDEYGNLYNDRGFNFVVNFPYRENIFEVDMERLAEYRLVAMQSTQDIAILRWYARFEVEIPDEGMELLIAEGLDIVLGRFYSIISQVSVSPYSVIISGYALPERCTGIGGMGFVEGPHGTESPQVRVHMYDGIVFELNSIFMSQYTATRSFIVNLTPATGELDLENVNAVEIDGYMIYFR